MPPENLHMTTFEIAQSLTKEEIDGRLATVLSRLEDITDYTFTHRTKLVKPMLSYDASAIALTFVPDSAKAEKVYTYHHVRRDLYNICKSTGVAINTRYVLPSAHLTIGRLVTERIRYYEAPSLGQGPGRFERMAPEEILARAWGNTA